jgi:hypothetical protein
MNLSLLAMIFLMRIIIRTFSKKWQFIVNEICLSAALGFLAVAVGAFVGLGAPVAGRGVAACLVVGALHLLQVSGLVFLGDAWNDTTGEFQLEVAIFAVRVEVRSSLEESDPSLLVALLVHRGLEVHKLEVVRDGGVVLVVVT